MTSRQRSVICSHPAGELVVPSRKCWRRPSSLRQMASSCQSAGKPACWSCKRDYRNRPGFVRKLAACRIPKDRRSRRTRCGRGAAPSREWRAECQRYPEMARGAVVSTRRWSAWPSPADASTACGSPGLIGRWARNHSTYSSALTARVALRRLRRRGRGPILAFLW